MKEKQISRTALLMAYVRGYHAMSGTLRIFEDNLAYDLLTDEERGIFEQQFTPPPIQLIESVDPIGAESCHNQADRLA
ncbi:hypothetical protein SAMN05660649_03796 [Desulfotomaculum arcticum]|uniref:Uncharacterized protein n=1 Tax=Desulfotruncus arcticus DSM 17038 TaxID=1121424 RepID=A0A1I2X821_9FIRM|nr:hypothetical protein [Desulfotruncus arcticus]SFH08856.1 hypothetical protein SAMN05660649_03796 [Desulfotomaculum arcticum] [Desulfotruncus arcticus DSM 17038]